MVLLRSGWLEARLVLLRSVKVLLLISQLAHRRGVLDQRTGLEQIISGLSSRSC